MKKLIVFFVIVVAGTSGFLIKVPYQIITPISEPDLAPSGWIHYQKVILPLFQNVCEESTDPIICRLSQEWISNVSASDFWDPEVIASFQSLKSGKGFLPKGQIFSDYNAEHTSELKVLFDVMKNAKTFDTFYKVAAWARQNLNCGLYVNLIYLALENRRDTEKLTLPPPYELLPNYFIRKDIIIQGSSLLAGAEFTPSEGVRDEGNAYKLDANYTANFYENDDESQLAYFREDIGLNSYYFLKMLKMAPWLNQNVDINSRYGEEMYHMIKQLVARYNLERYSNGMPEQDNLSWDSLSDAPYDPMLVYSNGNEFIYRTSPVQLPENEDKALLQTIESNIATVVSHMRDTGYNKTQILNHLMEILVTGERSYDALARNLFGKALSNNGQPTIFDHYMTSLRDPMIWKLFKNIVYLVDNSLKVLPPYAKNELYFPGVEVLNIEVKKMMTNFDYFEFDITEALKIGNGDTTFQVKIGQPRLNHKPFTVKLNISSLVSQKGLVKIYLGPKLLPGEFAKKKNMFSLLDSFEINIKKGSNVVTRSSNDMNMISSDFISLKTLFKKVEDAQFGLDSLSLNTINSQIGFPERLIVPKGAVEGLPLQIFAFVAPFMKVSVEGAYSMSNMEFNPAILSPLYPLDLIMEDRVLLDLPNALVKDFMVTHKGVSKVSNYDSSGTTNSWYNSEANGPPPRINTYSNDFNSKTRNVVSDATVYPENQYHESKNVNFYDGVQNDYLPTRVSGYDYSLKQKQAYGYKSKRSQYSKPDYTSNRADYEDIYKKKLTEPENLQIVTNRESESLANKEQYSSNQNEENPNVRYYYDVNVNKGYNGDNDVKQNYSPRIQQHYLLKSSISDFIEPKTKRPKVEKIDYKTMNKNVQKTTENPINVELRDKMPVPEFPDEDHTSGAVVDQLAKVEIFKIYKDNKKIDPGKIMSNNKYYDIPIVEDLRNENNLKTFKGNFNIDSSIGVTNKEYNKIVIENPKNVDSRDLVGILTDDKSKEILKVFPVATSSLLNDNTVYKYIMRVIHDDFTDNELDNAFEYYKVSK